MSQKYNITDEEINQTILHSPYSLADSPAKAGLKAMQIKKYFYEFIRFFAEKINIHLSDIDDTFIESDELIEQINQKIEDLIAVDNALGSAIPTKINAHNASSTAHSNIRSAIDTKISTHDTSSSAHRDMRLNIVQLRDKLNATYALASGKQRVYPSQNILEALEQISHYSPTLAPGDLFLVANDSYVDFTVFEAGLNSPYPNDIVITYEQVSNKEITLEAGNIYFFKGNRLLASNGNLETGLIAKQVDLEELEDSFLENVELVASKLSEINNTLSTKQDKLTIVDETAEAITLETGCEYNLGLRTSLALTLGETTDDLESIVNFRSGAGATSFDAPGDLYFTGDDTLDGRLYPVSNRIYEINIKNVMGVIIARVGACDFEVIE